MPKTFAIWVCAAALAGSSFFAGCATRPSVNGVPNFAEVEAGIYRGGQPNEQGWQFLRSLGVTNVVKLNREVADTPADGMNVYCIPLPVGGRKSIGPGKD